MDTKLSGLLPRELPREMPSSEMPSSELIIMLTNKRIQQILAEGEGLTTEFKRCRDTLPRSTYETVGSFSNRYGGCILLGVSDNGEVLGVEPTAVSSIKKDFSDVMNNPNKVTPTLCLVLDEAKIDGKTILYAYVPRSSQIQMISGRIYDRREDGDYDITGSTELIAQMSIRKSEQFTERKVYPLAKEEHLKLAELMPQVRQRAVNRLQDHPWRNMNDLAVMRSAGLYEDNPITGESGFNRAAILLFGRNEVIQQAVPGYVTDCLLRIDNVDRYDDRLRVETNLIESFDLLMEFISKHTLDRFFLIDNQNVSVRSHIAKEVVSNILCHREFSGTFPARIIIEKDRILAENWNRPLYPGRIDPNNYEPFPKNPIIARFFVNIGLADTLGSGVRNLYRYTRIYSGMEPELIEGDIFKTIIPIQRSSVRFGSEPATASNAPISAPVDDYNIPANDPDAPINDPVNDSDAPTNLTAQSLLAKIAINPEATLDGLAKLLSIDRSTVRRNMKKLRDAGLVKRVGPNKGGHWVIISNSHPSSNEGDIFKTIIPIQRSSVRFGSEPANASSAPLSTPVDDHDAPINAPVDDHDAPINAPANDHNAPINAPANDHNAPINLTAQSLLAKIARDPEATIDRLATLLSVDRSTVRRNMKKLRDAGLVMRMGPNKGGHWVIIADSHASSDEK